MSTPQQRLRRRISERGPIPFAEFMEEALYGEGGYYARGVFPAGVDADFITGSSLSPLFGQSTAELMRRLDRALGRPADLLEVGYGSGAHLQAVVDALGGVGDRTIIAVDRCVRATPAGVAAHEDLESVEPGSIRGLVFTYELFDAVPVHRLVGLEDGQVGELWVATGEEGFRFEVRDLSDARLLAALPSSSPALEVGQIADVTPQWSRLYRRLARRLGAGLVVTCDYGFEREQLLDGRVRRHGTLACYRQHRVHRDALRSVGEQDLSAHVDFSALREAGEEVGLTTHALTRQARWLTACGLFDHLEHADRVTRLQAKDLLDPAGMGEVIRVLVQGRGVDLQALCDPDLL